MLDSRVRRLLDAYPAIFLACHRQHMRGDDEGNTLSENQASVLQHLDEKRPATLSKLAEHMGVSRSTMSITISRLVRDGYIRRVRSRDDTRCIALTLTPSGARVKRESSVLHPDLVREMFRTMRPDELETALQGIECLAKHAAILLRRRKREKDG
jgi:MarR family transcriptional regulator, organic hydroperoxide resistance regulator